VSHGVGSAITASIRRSESPDAAGQAQGAIPLLPDATTPLISGGIDDALSLLYMAMAQQQQNSMQAGKSQVKAGEVKEKQALADSAISSAT
jgi:hypothetical protein